MLQKQTHKLITLLFPTRFNKKKKNGRKCVILKLMQRMSEEPKSTTPCSYIYLKTSFKIVHLIISVTKTCHLCKLTKPPRLLFFLLV